MRRVVIEHPFAPPGGTGTIDGNRAYLRACLRDALLRGEAPFASVALYAQGGVLDDRVPDERRLGMEAGFAWGAQAEACIVYADYVATRGMIVGIGMARAAGLPVEVRTLGDEALAGLGLPPGDPYKHLSEQASAYIGAFLDYLDVERLGLMWAELDREQQDEVVRTAIRLDLRLPGAAGVVVRNEVARAAELLGMERCS